MVKAHTEIVYCVLFHRFWSRSAVAFETLEGLDGKPLNGVYVTYIIVLRCHVQVV